MRLWPISFRLNVCECVNYLNSYHKKHDQKAASDPQAEICYHKVEHLVDDPTKFKITQALRVAFIRKDDEPAGNTKYSQGSVGISAPYEVWSGTAFRLMWIMRWTAKGLMPVKPVVYSVVDIDLLAGRAICMSE